MNEEMIIGKNPVIEALQSERKVYKVIISSQLNERTEHELTRMAKRKNVQIEKASRSHLDSIAKGKHQGIIGFVKPYEFVSIPHILNRAKQKNELPFMMILDELEDPHNLGAILRTAEATGVHGVIISKHRSVGLTSTVAKASAGAIEHVPVARVTNITRAIMQLKKEHIWIIGTDGQAPKDYRVIDATLPIAIVIGNEGKGMTRLVKEQCDWLIHLPMQGQISSLNASVAGALLMYEVFRKRNPIGDN